MALKKPQVTQTQTQTQAAVETQTAVETVEQAPEMSTQGVEETATAEVEPVVEQAPAVEAEVQPAQEVAVAEARPPVQRSEGNVAEFKNDLAEQGLEGLELDGFSFPTIMLPSEGFFKLKDDEDSNLGTSVNVQVMGTRPRFVVKVNDDDDAEFFMSYDPKGHTKTDGTSAEAELAQWAADSGEDNYRPVVKKYLDVTVTVLDGELEGEMAMLQVPGTSGSRLTGVFLKMKMRGIAYGDGVITAKVGKKVKKGSSAFYPWAFSLNDKFDG